MSASCQNGGEGGVGSEVGRKARLSPPDLHRLALSLVSRSGRAYSPFPFREGPEHTYYSCPWFDFCFVTCGAVIVGKLRVAKDKDLSTYLHIPRFSDADHHHCRYDHRPVNQTKFHLDSSIPKVTTSDVKLYKKKVRRLWPATSTANQEWAVS